jgi:hypothetical protein
MMKKSDVIATGKVSSKNLKQAMRCGECLHFNTKQHQDKGDLCKNEGVVAAGIAPPCFTPNYTKVIQSSDALVHLSTLMQELGHKERRILASVLMSKPGRLPMGKKIYFLASGKDYLSNYLAGWVVGYTSAREIVVFGDPDKHQRGNPYIAFFKDESSVFTVKEFKQKRAALAAKNRVEDPDQPLKKIRKTIAIEYEPPTMDNAPAHWHNKSKAPKAKKGDSKIKEIVISSSK